MVQLLPNHPSHAHSKTLPQTWAGENHVWERCLQPGARDLQNQLSLTSLKDRRLFCNANNQAVRCSENGIKEEREQLSSSGGGLDCPTDLGRVPGQPSAVLKGVGFALQTSLLHNTSFRIHSCQILMYPHANSPELVSARRKSCGINIVWTCN